MTTHTLRPCRLIILISGRGSNMQALVNACRQENWSAQVVAVIANQPDALGLQWAQAQGLATACVPHRQFADRATFEAALVHEIDRYGPDYLILAGFMRKLTPDFVHRYANRVVNIHPSLLPAFPGLKTHQQALTAGVQIHGCTVHFVTPVLDEGPIIAQACVPVFAQDTPDSLAQRVLACEHQLLPRSVLWLTEGRVQVTEDQRVVVQGNPQRLFMDSSLHSSCVETQPFAANPSQDTDARQGFAAEDVLSSTRNQV